MTNSIQQIIDYAELGYEITLTKFGGRQTITMRKRYSYRADKSLVCQQSFDHKDVTDPNKFAALNQFMYSDIEKQEEKAYKAKLKRINESIKG